MEDKRLLYLYQRFIDNVASAEELGELDEYLSTPVAKDELLGLLDAAYTKHGAMYSDISPESKLKVFQHLTDQFAASETMVKKAMLWPRIVTAAAMAIFILGAGLFFFKNSEKTTQGVIDQNDVAPGKQGATLTLANGKKIKLNGILSGTIAKESGIQITKSADGKLVYHMLDPNDKSETVNTLATSKGETYQLLLPDGSRIWLNAASSLTYSPVLYKKGKRKVSLTGEAYFEIAKDKKHPFIVNSKKQEVEVLGTHFNVNAYNDEQQIKTTLLEGSVRVSEDQLQSTLIPGEQAVSSGGSLQKSAVDVNQVMAWKEGYFWFKNEDIKSIMQHLSRWYNVEVTYKGEITTERYNARISRNSRLSQILAYLESTKTVHFKIEGRRIVVM